MKDLRECIEDITIKRNIEELFHEVKKLKKEINYIKKNYKKRKK